MTVPETLWRRPRSRRLLNSPWSLLREPSWIHIGIAIEHDLTSILVNGHPGFSVPREASENQYLRFNLKADSADMTEAEKRMREWIAARLPHVPYVLRGAGPR